LDPNNLHGPKPAQEFDKFTWQIYMDLDLALELDSTSLHGIRTNKESKPEQVIKFFLHGSCHKLI
jgi:hypothetical protein